MTTSQAGHLHGDELYTTVDDELFAELAELSGQRVVRIDVWDESLADLLDGVDTNSSTQSAFDLDLYLQDGVYFELYGTFCYSNPEADPLLGRDEVAMALASLVSTKVWLEEVAVDEDDGLVLVLAQQHQIVLYLAVGGWVLDQWDELPDN